IRRFVALDGGFRVVRALGAGFYPFPVPLANPLARLWPGASHTTVLLARKEREMPESPWAAWYRRGRGAGLPHAFGERGSPRRAPPYRAPRRAPGPRPGSRWRSPRSA